MDLVLKSKKALVTGATRGIGKAIVEHLAREGCDVALCSRNAEDAKRVASSLREHGVNAIGGAVDVTEPGAVARWVEESAEALGGVDILIPNVSALAVANEPASWQAGFETDLMGTVHTVDAALQFLERSSDAAITIVSSTAALEIYAGQRPYNSFKAALNAYSAGLAQDLAPKRIRANVVSPGTIYFEDGIWGRVERENPQWFAKALAANPLGRMGTPDDIAAAVTYISSPCASFVTGANLVVDGGFTRRVY